MKKIFKSLFLVFFVAVLATGATRAVWTDAAEIQNNQFTSGNADLDLWNGNSYEDNISTFTANNIYPGWNQDFTFWAKNTSSSDITMDVIAKLKTLTGNNLMKNNVMLYFTWDGGTTGEWTLQQWYDGQDSLGSLNQGVERLYTAHFRLPSTVGEDLENRTINFVVLLNATQALPSPSPL